MSKINIQLFIFSKDQRDGLKEAQKSIKEGDLIYELGASVWPRAIEHYKKAYDFNPDNSLLNYKLGTCYLYSIHKSWALDFLKKAYSLNPSVNQKIHFFLGKAHHFKYEFDDAIKEFDGDYDDEELRLYRIKFISEVAN